MFFIEPGDRRLAAQSAVATHEVPVVDVGGQLAPQVFKEPRGMLFVKIPHVVAESSFELPVGLRVIYRRVDQPDTGLCTRYGKKIALEGGAVVKDDRLRYNLPQAHGGDDRADRGAYVRVEKQIAEHIPARIVAYER